MPVHLGGQGWVARVGCRSVGGIEGIVNGMDTSEWCPTQDKCLDVKYDEETVAEGKGGPFGTYEETGLGIVTTRIFTSHALCMPSASTLLCVAACPMCGNDPFAMLL